MAAGPAGELGDSLTAFLAAIGSRIHMQGSSETGRSSTGGQNDEHGVHNLKLNRQVYSVEGADAAI